MAPQGTVPCPPKRQKSPADGTCHHQTLTARCHQCVIVTSSSHLLGTHLGTAIDGAECTIRMNDAPTTGYNADVGNKTSFRVVAHSSLYRVLKRPQEFVNKTPETIFIFWGPPTKMQKSLLKIIQRVCASFPNMTAYVVSPGRMKQFDDLFRGETGKDRYLRATSFAVSPLLQLPKTELTLEAASRAAALSWRSLRHAGDTKGAHYPHHLAPIALPVAFPPQGEVSLVAQHWLVHHGDRGGAVRRHPRLWHGATQLLRVRRPPGPHPSALTPPWGSPSVSFPTAAATPRPAACPTTTTSPRAPTSAQPTSTTSGAAGATTTASSLRRGSLPAGPTSTTSPSPTPPGPRGCPMPAGQTPAAGMDGGSPASPWEWWDPGIRCHQLPPTGPLLLCVVDPCTWDVLDFELVFGEQVLNVRYGVSPVYVRDTWP